MHTILLELVALREQIVNVLPSFELSGKPVIHHSVNLLVESLIHVDKKNYLNDQKTFFYLSQYLSSLL